MKQNIPTTKKIPISKLIFLFFPLNKEIPNKVKIYPPNWINPDIILLNALHKFSGSVNLIIPTNKVPIPHINRFKKNIITPLSFFSLKFIFLILKNKKFLKIPI